MYMFHLRDVSTISVSLRMVLAVLCGGLIGIEREFKRRPAGFRTHILVCLGAAVTTMTSQFLALSMGYATDIGRMGAQVVAGIGFIGAGTIIVTRRNRVKGLTTAAGLWTAAIVGLTIGAAFYEAAIIATALILLAELLFSKLEYKLLRREKNTFIYLEYSDNEVLDQVANLLQVFQISMKDLEIVRSSDSPTRLCATITVRILRKTDIQKFLEAVDSVKGILFAGEL